MQAHRLTIGEGSIVSRCRSSLINVQSFSEATMETLA